MKKHVNLLFVFILSLNTIFLSSCDKDDNTEVIDISLLLGKWELVAEENYWNNIPYKITSESNEWKYYKTMYIEFKREIMNYYFLNESDHMYYNTDYPYNVNLKSGFIERIAPKYTTLLY
jgi:hypothetical protein